MYSLVFYFLQNFLLANRVDADQMLLSAVSEVCLHCLHMSPKRVSSLKNVIKFPFKRKACSAKTVKFS